MKPEPEPFGSVIKRYRRAAGLTQEQAASRLHVDQSYLSKIETSRRIIHDLGLLARVAQVLKIPPRELGLSDELYAVADMRNGQQSGPGMARAEPPSGQAAVEASQGRWRSGRRQLNRSRAVYARQAVGLYPGSVRLGDTTLISTAGWLPGEPVDLASVVLGWRESVGAARVRGDEPEARRLLPLFAPGQQFDRYTSAIRYVEPPTLFENRPSYRLLGVRWANGGGRMEFGLSTYFDKLDLSETAGHEYAAAADSRETGPGWTELPFRALIADPFDCERRAVIPAVTTLTIRVDDGVPSFLLHWRDPARVATAGGMYDVIPAGEFQPSSITFWDQANDFDLWRNIVRELSEELLGMPEHDGSRSTPIDYESWLFYKELERARRDGRLYVGCLGVGLDALTLAATVLTVIVVDGRTFDGLFGEVVSVNAEGYVVSSGGPVAQGIPFTEEVVTRLLTSEPLASPGAGCLHLAWQHRKTLLGKIR